MSDSAAALAPRMMRVHLDLPADLYDQIEMDAALAGGLTPEAYLPGLIARTHAHSDENGLWITGEEHGELQRLRGRAFGSVGELIAFVKRTLTLEVMVPLEDGSTDTAKCVFNEQEAMRLRSRAKMLRKTPAQYAAELAKKGARGGLGL